MPRKPLADIPIRPIPTDPAALLTEVDVARLLGVSRQTLAKWRMDRRYLPFSRIGVRRIGYRRSDVDAFAARGRVAVVGEGT